MTYIRSKSVGGARYLYLVRSAWDPKRRTSRQEIIKYLGNGDRVTIEDIPPDYRDDPKIIAYLSSVECRAKKTQTSISSVRGKLFDMMVNGDLDRSLEIYESYTKHSMPNDFYEEVLSPVLYRVGDLWRSGKLDIAAEHISSNTARDLIGIITDRNKRGPGKDSVLLCTPFGEEHSLGCQMLHSSLQSRGFRVFNLAPAAPAESILGFIEDERPDLVMISITIPDNIRAGRRLVDRISSKYDVPILVGGQAVSDGDFESGCTVISDTPLDRIPRLVRGHIAASHSS